MKWITVTKLTSQPTELNENLSLNLTFEFLFREFELPAPNKMNWFNKLLTPPKTRIISNLFEDFNLLLRTDEGCEVDIEFRSKSLNVFLNSLQSMKNAKMFVYVKTSESSKRNDLLVNLDDDYFWRFWLFDVDQLTKSNEVDDIQVILPEEIYFAHENLRVSMTVDPEVNNLLREFLRTGKNKPSLKTLSRKVVYFVFRITT